MDYSKLIGARLREERERLNASQGDFAEIAQKHGVSGANRNSQSRYENGDQSPSANYLAALSAHSVDVNYVLTGVRKEDGLKESAVLDALRMFFNPAVPDALKTPEALLEAARFLDKQFFPRKDDGTPFVLGVDSTLVAPPKRRGRPPKQSAAKVAGKKKA